MKEKERECVCVCVCARVRARVVFASMCVSLPVSAFESFSVCRGEQSTERERER